MMNAIKVLSWWELDPAGGKGLFWFGEVDYTGLNPMAR